MMHWETRPIGTLVEDVATWNPLRENSEDTFQYIDLSAVDQDLKSIVCAREIACHEAPSRARQIVRSDDVLVSTVRPNLNGVAKVPNELDSATASTGFCVLRPKPSELCSNYLFHWVKSPQFVADMVSKATGASYPAISDKIIWASPLPYVPLSEQRRIAAILDQADALRAKRREALAQLDSLTQSIFIEMFGDPVTTTKDWPVVHLSDVTEMVTGYAFRSEEYVASSNDSIKLCRGANVMPGQLDWDDLACWPVSKADGLSAFRLEEGDVVIAMDRPWISEGFKIAQVQQSDSPSLLVQRVARIRGRQGISNDYVYHLLNQPAFTRHCRPTETTVPHISPRDIRSFKFHLPPESLRQTFVERVTVLRKQASIQVESLAELDSLFASLQHRAFRGEL